MDKYQEFVSRYTSVMFNVIIAFLLFYALCPGLSMSDRRESGAHGTVEVGLADRLLAGAVILLLVKHLHEGATRKHEFWGLHQWIEDDPASHVLSNVLLFLCTVTVPVLLSIFLVGTLSLPQAKQWGWFGEAWIGSFVFLAFFIAIFTVPDCVYFQLVVMYEASKIRRNGNIPPDCPARLGKQLQSCPFHHVVYAEALPAGAESPELTATRDSTKTESQKSVGDMNTDSGGIESMPTQAAASRVDDPNALVIPSSVKALAIISADNVLRNRSKWLDNLLHPPTTLLGTVIRWLAVSIFFAGILFLWAVTEAAGWQASPGTRKSILASLIFLHCLVDWSWNYPFYFSTNKLDGGKSR